MLRLNDVTIARGTRILYEHATAVADAADRVGLVGENGCGKSSLFAAILGELAPEAGTIDAPPLERISHVAQSVVETDEEALAYVLSGHAPLMAAKKEAEEAAESGDAMREAAALAQLAEVNEGAVRAQALTIMGGLGFLPADATALVKSFSGGWRNRLALARALMRPADLLLLDEPTNHLDMDSLIWLEAWLKRVHCTVIIISHDREFLDRATNTTWAIENGKLERYGGNYSFYETQRIEKMRLQDAAAKAYERQASHLAAFIERFRYKATKARQAQSRIKMLDKLQAVEPVRARREWRFEFPVPERTPEHLIDIEHLTLGYGEHVVLKDVTLTIRSGDRVGVLGVNGAGKSTLIKAIAGTLEPMSGTLRRGQGLVIGYFAQHQLEQLDLESTPLEVFKHKAPTVREQELRDWLGRFRFSGDFADTKIRTFSGGEKARLALALIAWDKPNLLVLDEPTNHLDMATREALTMALSQFEGALLLVSHDRHLLRSTCDSLILVHDGSCGAYDGDLDDYAALVLEHRKSVLEADRQSRAVPQAEPQVNRREERRQAAQERAQKAALKKPLLKKLADLEKRMNEGNAKLAELDAKIADSGWYASAAPEEVQTVMKERGLLADEVAKIEEEWLTVSEEIEAIG
ncbi:ABC-F family ATP-binding cassette domain-containing protein [Duodenibacillus massiliensis]|jgi:ABC transporter, ATP-binding protein|uniref:ABC-F family ATP-binding cassette domain-containing protein n=1 Tax=Duodenibacillus massiliensis TaxID=1852381 RepID=UPI00093AD100|nr:ABC-F family ATP-binding cassette domain-containing protein [Duodenibacillus massiliensis]HAF66060.1 ABC transporter ATP-binding protein [Sutterella sp.]